MTKPQIVILHTGGNDLASVPAGALRHRLTELAMLVQASLPSIMVIWSEMLPRLSYRGAKDDKAVNVKRESVNRYVRNFVAKKNMLAIRHSAISRADEGAFLNDGVHLRTQGTRCFSRNCGSLLPFSKIRT